MTVTTTVSIACLVLVADLGAAGWLGGVAIGNTVGVLAGIAVVPWRPPERFDRERVVASFRLGLPLLPHALSQWALQLADRFVLSGLVSGSKLGIYSLAANFSVPAFILMLSLNQGLMPGYAEAATDDDSRSNLSNLAMAQATVVTASCTALALITPDILRLTVDPAYKNASELVPWLVLGYMFVGLYYIPMNWLTLTAGNTSRVWVVTALCAVTNIALLYIFVPNYGITSAAVASAVAYLVLFGAMTAYSRRVGNPVSVDWSRVARLVAVCGLAYVGATLTTSALADAASLALRCAWIAGLVAGLLLTRVVSGATLRRASTDRR